MAAYARRHLLLRKLIELHLRIRLETGNLSPIFIMSNILNLNVEIGLHFDTVTNANFIQCPIYSKIMSE